MVRGQTEAFAGGGHQLQGQGKWHTVREEPGGLVYPLAVARDVRKAGPYL